MTIYRKKNGPIIQLPSGSLAGHENCCCGCSNCQCRESCEWVFGSTVDVEIFHILPDECVVDVDDLNGLFVLPFLDPLHGAPFDCVWYLQHPTLPAQWVLLYFTLTGSMYHLVIQRAYHLACTVPEVNRLGQVLYRVEMGEETKIECSEINQLTVPLWTDDPTDGVDASDSYCIVTFNA